MHATAHYGPPQPAGAGLAATLMSGLLLAGTAASPAAAAVQMVPPQPQWQKFGGGAWWTPPPPPSPPPQPPAQTDAAAATTGTVKGKRSKERKYSITQLRTALYLVAGNVAKGMSPKWASSAKAAGIAGAKTTVRRFGRRMLQVGRHNP